VTVIPAHGIDLGQLANSALYLKGVGISECLGLSHRSDPHLVGGRTMLEACSKAMPIENSSGPSIRIDARVLLSRSTNPWPFGAGVRDKAMLSHPDR